MSRNRKLKYVLNHKVYGSVTPLETVKLDSGEDGLRCRTDSGQKVLLIDPKYWKSAAEDISTAFRAIRLVELEKRAKKAQIEEDRDLAAARARGESVEAKRYLHEIHTVGLDDPHQIESELVA